MIGVETKNWKFHHLGLIVGDMDKAIEYYKSLDFVDFPPEPTEPPEPIVWEEIAAYGETVIKGGQPVVPMKPDARRGQVKFCSVGSITLELIQPGDAFKEVNGDFLKNTGEGIDHIAYTLQLHKKCDYCKIKTCRTS